jgi:hypothetical protein
MVVLLDVGLPGEDALRACEKFGRLLRTPLDVRDCVAVRENDGHLVH